MKALTLATLVLLTAVPGSRGQAAKNTPDDGEAETRRLLLLDEIRSLAADSAKLLAPLAQAAAEAEVADAAWSLDRELAERLLRDAYKRTLPKEGQAAFMELEAVSRTPGRNTALPTPDSEKVWRERRDKQIKAGEESATPDDRTINALIGVGEFDRARKAIDKLPEGPGKAQHTEKVNMTEALRLAYKGDTAGASLLAERLTKAGIIVEVYAALIKNCAGKKDAACVSNLALRAVRQLEKADASNFSPPAGMPSSFFAGSTESDASLRGLSRLAVSVAPFDPTLSFEIFERMVAAANRSGVDTKLGRAGYDVSVFRTMAALDETRARQAVSALDDGLRRVTALAAILKWKAEALDRPSGGRAARAAQ